MDIYLGYKLYKNFIKKDENFANGIQNNNSTDGNVFGIVGVIYFACVLYAGYLSWTCNSASDMNIFWKIISAFIAGLLSTQYLLTYFFFKKKQCGILKSMKP